MAFIINSNISADRANYFLSRNNDSLRKSMVRMASGKRVVDPSDDAGGLAVSMKMQSSAKRLKGAEQNIQNAISFLQVQDGVLATIDTSVFSSSFKEFFKNDSLGTFTISGGANQNDFTIDAKTGKVTLKTTVDWDFASGDANADGTRSSAELRAVGAAGSNFKTLNVTYTDRNNLTHVETINLTIKEQVESQLDDIRVESQAKATRAIETLDKALEQVSSAQAKLGAIQNRLQHNIDNLSKGAMLTEQAVGRVVDADFASETSSLSKQQILNQAATAMLAQANQSKQSVLSLLQ